MLIVYAMSHMVIGILTYWRFDSSLAGALTIIHYWNLLHSLFIQLSLRITLLFSPIAFFKSRIRSFCLFIAACIVYQRIYFLLQLNFLFFQLNNVGVFLADHRFVYTQLFQRINIFCCNTGFTSAKEFQNTFFVNVRNIVYV